MYPSYNTTQSTGYNPRNMESVNDDTFSAFSDKAVRMAFIRKVYGIISVQLIITMVVVLIFKTSKGVQDFAVRNPALLWVALAAIFVSIIGLTCCDLARSYPINLVCLAIFTLCQAFSTGLLCSFKSAEVVGYAVVVTTIIVVSLTIFAYQTKIDFTVWSGVMFVVLIVFSLFSIIMVFYGGRKLHMVYAALGTLIFSIYLVIDTQRLVGGNHKYQLSPEDYVFGALVIYMDIINIFQYVLILIDSMVSRD